MLNAFQPDTPVLSGEALIRATGVSRATGYRYLVSLQRAGLLCATTANTYMLGPRIAELDRQVRQCDPLFQAAGPPMRDLTRRVGHTSILCVLYADRVLCVRDERSGDGPAELFNRGQSRPLFVAAASKVILAYLNPRQLRRLWNNNGEAIAQAGLGSDWATFSAALRAIRESGFCHTVGEFRPGIAGLSAPVVNRRGAIIGSLGLAMAARHVTPASLPGLTVAVIATAAEITATLRASDSDMGQPPRAVGSIRLLVTPRPPLTQQNA